MIENVNDKITPPLNPVFSSLKRRRFVLFTGTTGRVNPVWIDDDESCRRLEPNGFRQHVLDDEGFIVPKEWHRYVFYSEYRLPNLFAFRCPASLSEAERLRIEFDDPPGKFKSRLSATIEAGKRGKGKPEPAEENPFG